tara:strand:- start:1430 stop:2101 length:672 start_codon:yes stop_codon:yes gene_type:complete
MASTAQVVQTQTGTGGKSFVRFDSATGEFTHGKENEDITGEAVVVNMKTFMHGWTLWHMRKPTKIEVLFNQPLPQAMDSKENSKGKMDHPNESRSFDAAFTDEDDTIISFGSSTYGGRKGCDDVLNAFLLKAASGESVYLYPVVELNSENYTSAEWGKIFNPVFAVVDWMAEDGTLESATTKLDKPAKKKKAAPVEEAEEAPWEEEVEEAEAAPTKRRRRSAE